MRLIQALVLGTIASPVFATPLDTTKAPSTLERRAPTPVWTPLGLGRSPKPLPGVEQRFGSSLDANAHFLHRTPVTTDVRLYDRLHLGRLEPHEVRKYRGVEVPDLTPEERIAFITRGYQWSPARKHRNLSTAAAQKAALAASTDKELAERLKNHPGGDDYQALVNEKNLAEAHVRHYSQLAEQHAERSKQEARMSKLSRTVPLNEAE